MRHYPLGRTGLYVSELCLGTMTFGGKGFGEAIGKLETQEVDSLVGTALDSGVNFIDTADVSSDGESERLIGATFEETVETLDSVVRSGKARYVGFSNLPAWLAAKAVTCTEAHRLARFQSAQVHSSIADRDIEREIVPLARSKGLAILPWSPLAGGLLSGKFELEKKGPEGSRRSQFDFPPVNVERLPRALHALRDVATATGVSVARVALGWQLTKPFVTSIIIGAKNREQLLDNLQATRVKLAPEQVKTLDDASAPPPEYPGWMVDWQNREPRMPEA